MQLTYKQRQLAKAFLAVWVFIYWSIPMVPLLNEMMSRMDIAAVVWRGMGVMILAVIGWLLWTTRDRQTITSWVTVTVFCVTAVIVTRYLGQPARGLHFVGYGFLGFLGYRFFLTLTNPFRSALATLCFVGAIGWGDEWIQWLVPARTYSLIDVGLNGLGAMMGLLTSRVWPSADTG